MITRRGSRHRARGLLFSPAPGVMVVSDQFGRSAKRVPRVSARAQRERASDHRLRGDRHEVLIKGPAKTSSSHLHLLFRPLPEEARLPPPPLAATRKHATSEEAREKKYEDSRRRVHRFTTLGYLLRFGSLAWSLHRRACVLHCCEVPSAAGSC